jgi:hypothetical protein
MGVLHDGTPVFAKIVKEFFEELSEQFQIPAFLSGTF